MAIKTKLISVTRTPPSLSEIIPPAERAGGANQRAKEGEVEDIYVRKLGFRQHGKACRETDKRAEGCQIKQAQQPEVKALKYRKLAGNGCFRAGDVVHAKKTPQGWPESAAAPRSTPRSPATSSSHPPGDAVNAEKGKHRQENHQRRNQLHHAHTRGYPARR